MDETAIFKISYGMFFLGCKLDEGNKKNVCVVNTVAQVTQEPIRVSVTILKNNLTHDYILKAKQFSVGVMGINTSLDVINRFGSQSGRDVDKLADFAYKTDILGNPLIDDGCIASLCCKVIQTVDLDTHTTFIADLVDAKTLSNDQPMTYNDYRAIRSGNKHAASTPNQNDQEATYQCTVCHYVYDGETPFEDLPDDYICPICKKPKSAFVKV